jgi:hypothetical protein
MTPVLFVDVDFATLLTATPMEEDTLSDLSVLSSLESSPTSTPILNSHQLPDEFITQEHDDPLSRSPDAMDQSNEGPSRATYGPQDDARQSETWKGRKNKKTHEKRKARRRSKKEASTLAQSTCRPSARRKHIKRSNPIQADIDAADFPVASSAYVGIGDEGGRTAFTLQNLVGSRGFRLVEWDGRSALSLAIVWFIINDNISRTPMPIVDKQGRIIGVLGGSPDDPTWSNVHQQAAQEIESSRDQCHFSKKQKVHRRGRYSALASGISIGPGGTRPVVLNQHPANKAVISHLFAQPSFIRLTGHTTSKLMPSTSIPDAPILTRIPGIFSSWSPRLFKCYCDYLEELLKRHPELFPNFPNSPWASATINFGPKTVCFKHRDFNNLPFGWCAITSLGDFDPTLGGHLILWELKLVITFPPGSTILIPSACITHCNTTVRPHETRYSFTQYTSGGLFRWVDRGFQQKADYEASLTEEEVSQEPEKAAQRLNEGLSLFSTMEELRDM